MNNRVLGPQGVPLIGGARPPSAPVLMELKRVQQLPNGETQEMNLCVVGAGVLYIDQGAAAELAAQIAPLIAPLIVQAVLETAAQGAKELAKEGEKNPE